MHATGALILSQIEMKLKNYSFGVAYQIFTLFLQNAFNT